MDLGGAFLGPIEQDQRISNAASQEARARELHPALLAQHLAAARMTNAEATQMEQNAATEKAVATKLAEKMGTPGSTAAESSRPISAVLTDIASAYSDAGAVKKAEEAYKAASTAAQHEGAQLAKREQNSNQRIASQMKQGQLIASLLDGVKDQAGWEQANEAFATQTGKASPFADHPYDPKFVSTLQKMGTTMAQRAQESMAEQRLQATKEAEAERIRHDKVSEGLQAQRVAIARDRAERVGKTVGKDVGAPEASTVKAAKGLLQGLVPEDQMDTAAFDIASDAKAKRKANPGLSASDALGQAVQDAREAGNFRESSTPPKKVFGIPVPMTGGDKKAEYETPKSMPKSGKAADLVKGQRYKDPKSGAVGVWNGKGWDKPEASKPAKGRTAPVDDEEDDSDE